MKIYSHRHISSSRCQPRSAHILFFAFNLLPNIFGLYIGVLHIFCLFVCEQQHQAKRRDNDSAQSDKRRLRHRTMDEPQAVVCATAFDVEFSVLWSIQHIFSFQPKCVSVPCMCSLIYVPIDCSMLDYIGTRSRGAYLTTIFRFFEKIYSRFESEHRTKWIQFWHQCCFFWHRFLRTMPRPTTNFVWKMHLTEAMLRSLSFFWFSNSPIWKAHSSHMHAAKGASQTT